MFDYTTDRLAKNQATKTNSYHRDFIWCYVWGWPVFVLEPKFHNDQNLPKWNKQAHMGQVFGFSGEHSSPVSNVSNLSTEYISPQFHLVFADFFGDDNVFNDISNYLFDLNRDWYDKY